MPAYRSSAEAEIRDAVVARLRVIRPGARIIHEINAGTWGPNRIDVLAVDRAEIIAVEVKSARDKIDRLPAQIRAMSGVAHHVVAALHERFLVPLTARGFVPGSVVPPDEAEGATVWAWPEAGAEAGRTWGCARWVDPRPCITTCLPHGALDFLWADELARACVELAVPVRRRATRPEMMAAIRWRATGGDVTRAICAALRRRPCVEADDPIEVAVA